MPVYQYKCEHCNITFEKLLEKVSDKKEACPKCSKKSQKIPAPMTFILKGSGWANDGYTSKK